MIKKQAILRIGDAEYEILRCGYRFSRDVDAKGRPTTGLRGGAIWVEFESLERNTPLIQMLLDKMPPISGSVEFLGGVDEDSIRPIRTITFDKAWICEFGENQVTYSYMPMVTRMMITPVRLDIGDNVKLDRRWPETSGFCWEKYEKPKTESGNPTKERTVTITDIYWKNQDGRKITELPESEDAVMCILTENYVSGDTLELELDLGGEETVKISGIIDSNGIVEVPQSDVYKE